MAISSDTRKAGPFSGNDVTVAFPFAFKVFEEGDLIVVHTDIDDVETELVLGSDFTVELNFDQDNDPGGTITLATAPADGEKLTITSDVPARQPLVLTNNGGFYPRVINDAFDRITIIAQQLIEQMGRTIKLPISSTASAQLPEPQANAVLTWNSTGDGFANVALSDLATVSGYADARVEVYTGDGVKTAFLIDFNPGVLANLDISVGGVTQTAGVDFTWAGTTVTFAEAPPDGATVQIRYARPIAPVPNFDEALTAVTDAQAAAASAAASAAEAGNKLDKGQALADLADKEAATNNLLFLQSGTGAVSRGVRDKLRDIFDARDWGCVADGSSQQSKVQEAIDDLASVPYAVLNIPNGVIFNSQTLDFSTNHRIVLRFPRDCDSGAIGPYAGGTGEIITLAVTSEYPTDASSAYVAENIFEGPIHPAVLSDARPDLTGASSGLGAGQSLLAPVRATLGIKQERTARHHITMIYYGDAKSNFSGVYFRSYRQTYTLQGVGSSAWVSAPVAGDLVTASNGAKGYVTAIDASTLTVEWITGRFASGTTLADSNESGIGPITTATRNTIQEMSPLAQSVHNGAWAINCAPGLASSVLTVGGDARVRPWQSFGQYTPTDQQTQWPGFVWENPGGGGASARQISGVNTKRVFMYDGTAESASPRGMLGAVCVAGRFGPALTIGSNCINVATVSRIALGDYQVTFSREMARTSYITICTMDGFYSPGYTAGGTIETTTTVRLKVFDATGAAADIPANGSIHFAILGGDI